MGTPGWLNESLLNEEWPAAAPSEQGSATRLDFGAFPAQDFDARTSSSASPRDNVGTFVRYESNTLIQHGSKAHAPARAPLAAIAAETRSMFGPNKLQSLFEPLQQSCNIPDETRENPFTFSCRPTAIRMPSARQECISPLAGRHQGGPDRELTDFSLEPENEEKGGADYAEHSSSRVHHLHITPEPAKRQRLLPREDGQIAWQPSYDQGQVQVPTSAVRERYRGARGSKDRRSSLPPSFPSLESATPAQQHRYSLPLTIGRGEMEQYSGLDRSAKRESIMQQVRTMEIPATPIRTPATRREMLPPPTVGAQVLDIVFETEEGEEEEEEEDAEPEEHHHTSYGIPMVRPSPPTPQRAQQGWPGFWSSQHALKGHSTATPVQDRTLAASAVDELFPPSPTLPPELALAANTALPNSATTSPELGFGQPRSAMKRAVANMTNSGHEPRSPRSVSFGEQATQALHSDQAAGKKSGSALRHEINAEESLSVDDAKMGRAPLLPPRVLSFSRLGQALQNLKDSQGSARSAGSAASSESSVFAGRKASRIPRRNATFLTECSFGVAEHEWIRYLTDVEPNEPHWSTLAFVDLSNKKIESLIRLKDYLPALDEADLSDNLILYLTGLPEHMRGLQLARNRLHDLTCFQMLQSLERLDLSDNSLEHVKQLSCLHHLRELKIDRNKVQSIEGIHELDTLVELSMRGNALKSFEAPDVRWPALKRLDLAGNCITRFSLGADASRSLVYLNLDSNRLPHFALMVATLTLRVLRLSKNPLAAIDVRNFPNVRSLFVDDTDLRCLGGLNHLHKLESLSVRALHTGINDCTFSETAIQELRRIYLSGQQLTWRFIDQINYSLVYVELAMCRISKLPSKLATALPNCRTLILDGNEFTDIAVLKGMQRLQRLSVMSCRIGGCLDMLVVLQTLTDLAVLDVRGNPCVSRMYLPAALPTAPVDADHAMHGLVLEQKPASRHSAVSSAVWQKADVAFASTLTTKLSVLRSSWRALAVREAPSLRFLDGHAIRREATGGQILLDKLNANGSLARIYKAFDDLTI